MDPKKIADLNHDDKVDVEDARFAAEYLDEHVKPHGWGWTVTMLLTGLVIGAALGRCVS